MSFLSIFKCNSLFCPPDLGIYFYLKYLFCVVVVSHIIVLYYGTVYFQDLLRCRDELTFLQLDYKCGIIEGGEYARKT